MLPSLVMPVTVETWLSKPLPVIDPLFSKLPLLVSISVPLEIIEPLITYAKADVIADHADAVGLNAAKAADVDAVLRVNRHLDQGGLLPAEVTEPELLSMVKLPALTRALLACTLPLILIASASRTA